MIQVSYAQLVEAWLLAVVFALIWGQFCTWRERRAWQGREAAKVLEHVSWWLSLDTAAESWARLSTAVEREERDFVRVRRELVEVVPTRHGGVH